MKYYVLDDDGNPVPFCDGCDDMERFLIWAKWFDKAERRVAVTEDVHGQWRISTVFLGLDHQLFGNGPPLLFETMVFGGPFDQQQERYSTREQALKGHERMVRRVTGKLVTNESSG